MATEPDLSAAWRAIRQLQQRCTYLEEELAELKSNQPRRSASELAARLNALGPAERATIEAATAQGDQAAQHAAELRDSAIASGQTRHPPPAKPGQVVWSLPRDIHKADEFMGWVFPFPTNTGHVLCNTDLAEPFGVHLEVQLADGRRFACSFTELEKRS